MGLGGGLKALTHRGNSGGIGFLSENDNKDVFISKGLATFGTSVIG